MADLIDRNDAIKLLRGEAVGKYPQSFYFGLFAAANEIRKLPAVDAEPVPMTNGDRIRAMTDEGLAVFLECFSSCAVCKEAMRLDDNPFKPDEKCDEDCELHILEWLKQPVEATNDNT